MRRPLVPSGSYPPAAGLPGRASDTPKRYGTRQYISILAARYWIVNAAAAGSLTVLRAFAYSDIAGRCAIANAVRLDFAEELAFLTLDHPATRNALTPAISQGIVDACQELAERDDVRAVIVRGRDDFCAGSDPDDPIDPLDGPDPAAALAALAMPTIAAIRGACHGVGLALALACDLRFAARDTTFALPDLVAGGFPSLGASQRLPRIVGRAKALELILTGAEINALEAHRIDLVSDVVEPDALDATVLTAARAFLGRAPIAVRYAKEAIAAGSERTLEQAVRLEADLYLLLHTTQDRREGIESFLGRRVPRFRNE